LTLTAQIFLKSTVGIKNKGANIKTLLNFLAQETGADKSYGSNKFCFENIEVPKIEYEDSHQKNWNVKESGETLSLNSSKLLIKKVNELKKFNTKPLFKYFLDGSRRTYKVDDVAYGNNIYPIVAGQIGVGCCKRENPDNFTKALINMYNVIVMPNYANASGQKEKLYFNNLLSKINNLEKLQKLNINFDEILTYSKKDKDDLEDLAVAKIQDKMVELEKIIVANLVKEKLLNEDSYLIKDGSLEYKVMKTGNYKELAKIKNNYRHVVGVSKRFNPNLVINKRGKSNASLLADLPLYHRTPAIKYKTDMAGEVYFAIWYVRIRDKKYTNSPFEGILKLEKILVTDNEIKNGLESEEVDNISANIINERNPVCYGSDNRWANHLYPVYLTEKYIKSQYLSDIFFLNLF